MTSSVHPTTAKPETPYARRQAADRRRELARQLRVDSVRMTAAAKSGHPTSSMSAADLIAVLIDGHLRYDLGNPRAPENDHLIFSKGHASPLVYAMLKAVGVIDDQELMTYRQLGSRLQGHPVPVLPLVDVATGSLGQGLPIGVGIALAGKRLDALPYRVWVLCGDSETAEGSMWEAFERAAFERLDNLTAIIDVNRLGQTGPTMLGWDLDAYRRRYEAIGWRAIEVDGHDVEAIDEAYREAEATRDRPTVILARTEKGRGVAEVEDKNGLHGKPLPHSDEAVEELGGERTIRIDLARPDRRAARRIPTAQPGRPLPFWKVGEKLATRRAYGEALAALGSVRSDVVALDGEVSNSTYSELFREAFPERYFEMYIAEQQMVAAAVGLQVRGCVPFASSFAAFLSRASDFVRMAAISRANIRLVGSHAGVSIGEDGPSQMGLEDIAFFRAVHGSTIVYPCDANQTAKLVALMADLPGITYLRTTRGATPVIYDPTEVFGVGGSRTLRSSDGDRLAIVAAGITVHEALEAADRLAADGIGARVIDSYSIKPIDKSALFEAARLTEGRLIVVEDHWEEGGLGDAVLDAFVDSARPPLVVKLAVAEMPGSGKPEEMLHAAGIDADAIEKAARRLVQMRV